MSLHKAFGDSPYHGHSPSRRPNHEHQLGLDQVFVLELQEIPAFERLLSRTSKDQSSDATGKSK